MNNSLHGSNTSNEGSDDAFINETPDGMENYVEDTLFPMLDEGSLDHAILESLFYNEMALLNSTSGITDGNAKGVIPTLSVGYNDSFLTTQAYSTKGNTEHDANSFLAMNHTYNGITQTLNSQTTLMGNESVTIPIHGTQDENSIFQYVNTTDPFQNLVAPQPYGNTNLHPAILQNRLVGATASENTTNNLYPYPLEATQSIGENPTFHHFNPQEQISVSRLPRKLTVQLPKHTIVTGGGIRHNVVSVKDNHDVTGAEQQLPATPKDVHMTANPTSPTIEEKKRKKLIAQFATLAGRLGITLPPQVLQKLTDKAADATKTELTTSTVPNPILSDTVNVVPSPPEALFPTENLGNTKESESPSQPQPVLLQQVQKSAAEAIAAVDNKRSITTFGSTANGEASNNASDGNKPFTKKRKKPRLSDCEQKLEELKNENSILKRHLDNIANQNARLDEERIKAERQMRQMLQDNAPDAILDPVVKNFTEMYSDYGRKRHDELNFHLQQLQR
jgi:hypothetical protein